MDSVGVRRSILWRLFKWTGRGLLIFIGLFAIVWSIALFLGARRLEAALIKSRTDVRLSNPVAQNWLSPVPGENAAPYFSAAIALVAEPDQRQDPDVTEFLRIGWNKLPESRQARLRSWLAAKQVAFVLAAQGADRPWCRYYRNWNDAPWKVHAPELKGVLNLGTALVVRARVQVLDGQHEDARESIRIAFAIADSLRDDPFVMSQLVRAWVYDYVLQNLQEIVVSDLKPDSLRAWMQIIPGPERFDGVLERAAQWEYHVFSALLSGPMSQFWEGFAHNTGRQDRSSDSLYRLRDPIVMFDAARVLEQMAEKIRIFRMPYTEARAEAVRLEQEMHCQSRFWAPVSRYPCLNRSPSIIDSIEEKRAKCIVVRTGLQWEIMRLEWGKYPEKCEAIDPFSGKPLLIESAPARLTSVGRGHPSKTISWSLQGK